MEKDFYLRVEQIGKDTSTLLLGNIPLWVNEKEDVLFGLVASWEMLKVPVLELCDDCLDWIGKGLIHVRQEYQWIRSKDIVGIQGFDLKTLQEDLFTDEV